MNLSRGLLVIIVLAVLVRVGTFGYVLAFGSGEIVLAQGDSIGYQKLATSLAHGEGFSIVNDAGERVTQTFRTPGLPLLIAPFTLVPHGIVYYALLLSILAGILVPLLTYRIGAWLFDAKVGMVAAALSAFEPHMIWFSWLPLSEMPFIIIFLGALYLLIIAWERGKYLWLLSAGALLGYAILIRPSYLLVFGATLVVAALWFIGHRRPEEGKRLALIVVGVILILMPWSLRNASVAGSYAISGAGWFNVYFDYVSAVLAIEQGVDSQVIKKERRANPPGGIPQPDAGNPVYAPILRDVALRELAERPLTVLKLEAMLGVTFFTNDSYYYYLRRYGFINDEPIIGGPPRSATFAVLTRGTDAMSHLLLELRRQHYIPLFGRAFTASIFVLACIGVWVSWRRPIVWLIVLTIGVTAVTSTVIGMGLEGRLRVPVQPFLFILAAIGGFWLYAWAMANRYISAIVLPCQRFAKRLFSQAARGLGFAR